MSLPETYTLEKLRHDWLSERSRWAGVSVNFGSDGVYVRHRVTWHVPGAWLNAEGQSFEEAVDNAMLQDTRREGEGEEEGE